MRIAVLSDIHGNITALKAALAKAQKLNANFFIYCGDYITDFPNHNEVLDLIKTTGNVVIKGNREENCLKYLNGENTNIDKYKQLSSLRWCYNTVTSAHLEYIKSLSETKKITIGGKNIFICHGSPMNISEVLKLERDKDKIDLYLKNSDCDIILGGHSHRPFIYKNYNKIFVNPGSVGLGFSKPLTAELAIIDIYHNGKIAAHNVFAKYNLEDVEECFKQTDLKDSSPIWSALLIDAIKTATNKPMKYINFVNSKTPPFISNRIIEDHAWDSMFPSFLETHK